MERVCIVNHLGAGHTTIRVYSIISTFARSGDQIEQTPSLRRPRAGER